MLNGDGQRKGDFFWMSSLVLKVLVVDTWATLITL